MYIPRIVQCKRTRIPELKGKQTHKKEEKIQQLNIGNYYTNWVEKILEKSRNLVSFSFAYLSKLTRNPNLRFSSALRSCNGPGEDLPDHNEQYSPGWVSGGVPLLRRQFSLNCVRLCLELHVYTVEVLALSFGISINVMSIVHSSLFMCPQYYAADRRIRIFFFFAVFPIWFSWGQK